MTGSGIAAPENGSLADSARRNGRALAGASAFRATEAALGVAASELFAALPKAYREQFAELPAIVAALEARAAEARAEADVVAALAPSGSVDAEVLAARRKAAAAHLGRECRGARGHSPRPPSPARGRQRSRAAYDADGCGAAPRRGCGAARGCAARGGHRGGWQLRFAATRDPSVAAASGISRTAADQRCARFRRSAQRSRNEWRRGTGARRVGGSLFT